MILGRGWLLFLPLICVPILGWESKPTPIWENEDAEDPRLVNLTQITKRHSSDDLSSGWRSRRDDCEEDKKEEVAREAMDVINMLWGLNYTRYGVSCQKRYFLSDHQPYYFIRLVIKEPLVQDEVRIFRADP